MTDVEVIEGEENLETPVEEMSDEKLAQAAGANAGSVEPAEAESDEEAAVEPELTPDQKRIADLESQVKVLAQERRNFELRADRQGMELGELRKLRDKLLARKQELAERNLHKELIENPRAFADGLREEQEIDRGLHELQQREGQAHVAALRDANYRYLSANEATADFPNVHNDIVEMIKADGMDSPENIERFQRDPLSFPTAILVSLTALAKARKQARETDAQLKKLKEGGSVLSKIDRAARQRPVTGASGGTSAGARSISGDLSDRDIDALSDADLTAMLNEAKGSAMRK